MTTVASNEPFRITALVPMFNAEKYVAETIDAVLSQTLPPAEVVVVDDGSTDGSAGIVAGFGSRVRLITRPNGGVSAARNTGIAAAAHPWIAVCDADDVWLPCKLERQVDAIRRHPEIGVALTWLTEFLSPELPPGSITTRAPMDVATGPLITTMLAHHDALHAVGPFDEEQRVGDWVEWYSRLVDTDVVVHMVPEVLARRRHHLTNNSQREAAHNREMLRSMRAHLDRRRATS